MTGPAPHGTPEALREFIAEHLNMACIHASHAVSYAEIGNDAGLEFAIRNAALYFRAAIDTMKQLKAEKAAKAVEEEFA
jgi:hypothetical protein